MKSFFPKMVVLIAIVFLVFALTYHGYKSESIRRAIQDHAKIVSIFLWDFNSRGVKEYLSAVAMHYNYEYIAVRHSDGTEFVRVQRSEFNSLENNLIRFKLIPHVQFSADVFYGEQAIGTIEVHWLDKSIFVYAYAFLICLLLLLLVRLYDRILDAKANLELEVESRTKTLTEQKIELQKSEELYRRLVDNICIGVALVNPQMEIITLSRQMKEWFPAVDETQRPMCHKSFNSPPKQEACKNCPTRQTFRDGLVHEGWLETQSPKGVKYYRVVSSPIKNGAGDIVGAIEMFEDRTDRKKSEEEALKLKTQLQQAQKLEAIGTLAGGIAHDFNNILSAICGFAELAKMKTESSEVIQDLNEVLMGAGRAAELVQQILTFSRKGEQEKRVLQMSLIVKEALKLLRPSIPTTIEIKQEIASDASVLANPTQIHQVIVNLCTNAYHAMRVSGGMLHVGLTETDVDSVSVLPDVGLTAKRYLQLEIGDTGSGMNKETLLKIFEPYFTTKTVGEGTGLGLAVVHGIVKDHDGSIYVDSETGKGTVFRIFLPIYEGIIEESRVEEKEMPLVGGNESIMHVDDDVKVAELVQQSLGNYGYKVNSFTNSMQAYQEFERHPDKFEILIVDMTMPFITGIELAMKAMKIRPQLPVILCTGDSESIEREEVLATGIREYCRKPLDIKRLALAVRKILDESMVS